MKEKIIFLIWPFISILRIIKSGFRNQSSKTIFWLFFGFLGLNLSIYSESADINVLTDNFISWGKKDFKVLQEIIFNWYGQASNSFDFLSEIIYYTLSRFTLNQYLLYMTFGLIFGFFFSSVICRISKFIHKLTLMEYFLIFSLIFIVSPMKGIIQFRYYTASIIFIYGVLRYIIDNDKKSFFYIFLSIITHIGLVLPALGFLLFILFDNFNDKIVFNGMIISIILITLNGVSYQFFESYIVNFNDLASKKFSSYNGEIADIRFQATRDRVFYAAYFREIVVSGLLIPIFFIFRKRSNLENVDVRLIKLSFFLIFVTSFTLNQWMYHRYFDTLSFLLCFVVVNTYLKYKINGLRNLIILISPVLLLAIGINVVELFNYQEIFFFINNIFTVWFFH